jgi:hypothetical protein
MIGPGVFTVRRVWGGPASVPHTSQLGGVVVRPRGFAAGRSWTGRRGLACRGSAGLVRGRGRQEAGAGRPAGPVGVIFSAARGPAVWRFLDPVPCARPAAAQLAAGPAGGPGLVRGGRAQRGRRWSGSAEGVSRAVGCTKARASARRARRPRRCTAWLPSREEFEIRADAGERARCGGSSECQEPAGAFKNRRVIESGAAARSRSEVAAGQDQRGRGGQGREARPRNLGQRPEGGGRGKVLEPLGGGGRAVPPAGAAAAGAAGPWRQRGLARVPCGPVARWPGGAARHPGVMVLSRRHGGTQRAGAALRGAAAGAARPRRGATLPAAPRRAVAPTCGARPAASPAAARPPTAAAGGRAAKTPTPRRRRRPRRRRCRRRRSRCPPARSRPGRPAPTPAGPPRRGARGRPGCRSPASLVARGKTRRCTAGAGENRVERGQGTAGAAGLLWCAARAWRGAVAGRPAPGAQGLIRDHGQDHSQPSDRETHHEHDLVRHDLVAAPWVGRRRAGKKDIRGGEASGRTGRRGPQEHCGRA